MGHRLLADLPVGMVHVVPIRTFDRIAYRVKAIRNAIVSMVVLLCSRSLTGNN